MVIVQSVDCSNIKAYGNTFVILSELRDCKINNCYKSNLRKCSNSEFNRVRYTILNSDGNDTWFFGYRFEDITPSFSVSLNTDSLDAKYKGSNGTGWIASYNEYTNNELTIYRHNVEVQAMGSTPYPYTGVYWDANSSSWIALFTQPS